MFSTIAYHHGLVIVTYSHITIKNNYIELHQSLHKISESSLYENARKSD